jgi:hypothetical protein
MSSDEILPAAFRLPLESLTGDRSDEEAALLAIQRDAEMAAGTVAPLSHVELMTRLRG